MEKRYAGRQLKLPIKNTDEILYLLDELYERDKQVYLLCRLILFTGADFNELSQIKIGDIASNNTYICKKTKESLEFDMRDLTAIQIVTDSVRNRGNAYLFSSSLKDNGSLPSVQTYRTRFRGYRTISGELLSFELLKKTWEFRYFQKYKVPYHSNFSHLKNGILEYFGITEEEYREIKNGAYRYPYTNDDIVNCFEDLRMKLGETSERARSHYLDKKYMELTDHSREQSELYVRLKELYNRLEEFEGYLRK